jgi:hypothetical protein
MSEEIKELQNKEVTRRSALVASALAVTGLLSPKEAKADSTAMTKNDINKMAFSIESRKNSAEKYERKKNKSTVVDKTVKDETFPTAKAVYNFIKDKENYTQAGAKKGEALFVGDDGKTELREYTVDESFKEDSSNPVQGKVIYEKLKEINERVSLDDVPTKAEEKSGESGSSEDSGDTSEDIKVKHVCKSNGYWITYQAKQDCPEDLTKCEMGINYRLESKNVTNGEKHKWAVNRVDDAYIALCENEFGGVYLNKKATVAGTSWKEPQVIWHT